MLCLVEDVDTEDPKEISIQYGAQLGLIQRLLVQDWIWWKHTASVENLMRTFKMWVMLVDDSRTGHRFPF